MADANKTALYIKREAFGTAATGSGAFQVPFVSESLAHTQTRIDDQEIRSDGQINASIRNTVGAGGDLNINYRWGLPFHGILALALRWDNTASWIHGWGDETQVSGVFGASADASSVSVGSTTTFDLGSGSWINTPNAGDFLRVTGFDTAANNGLFRVSSATSSQITLPSAVLTAEAAGNYTVLTYYEPVLANGTATVTTTQFTHGSGWTNTPSVGDWIYVSGFSTAANNGFFKVTAATSTTITTHSGQTGSESGVSGVNIVILSAITNGTTKQHLTLERFVEDGAGAGSDIADVFTGLTVGGLTINLTPDQIVNGSVSLVGKKQASAGTASTFTAPIIPSATDPFSGVDQITGMWIAGTSVTPTAVSVSITNNLRPRLAIDPDNEGPVSMGMGRFGVSGSISIYLEDAANTEYAKAIGNTASSLAFVLEDAYGNAYIFDLPKVWYGEPRRVAGGVDTDIIVELPFNAVRSETENVTMRIAKF